MGGGLGSYSTTDYGASMKKLEDSGTLFSRSAKAHATRDFSASALSKILDPRKLKNGMRESCYPPNVLELLSIAVGIDGTGSMITVPRYLQGHLPELVELLLEKGIAEHVNLLFSCFDDERATPPDGCFQISQFELEPPKLVASLNEMVIVGNGGGNQGEAYHLYFYGLAFHTRLESFEKEGKKGHCFLICDEEPYYDNEDPSTHGTTPGVAKEVFGDTIEAEVSMLESVKKTVEHYHVFIIRPADTSHGANRSISRQWSDLLAKAGENPQNVLDVENQQAILPAMALAIGRIEGMDGDELVDVLRAKGVAGIDSAAAATKDLVPVGAGTGLATVSESIDTGVSVGRDRS